jgi:tripartite-type tricarboxylate transporter receptor subunit TctC
MAQGYPAGPVRIVVPFQAGGSTDIMARAVAHRLSERFRQTVVVENRSGANGTIGTAFVVKSPPDGHTMLLVQASFVSNPSLYKNLPYNQARDLAPVTNLASGPLALTVHPSLPAASVKQLMALAKSRRGEINFGSPGIGSISHLACELFNVMAGVVMTHITYKGTGAALSDMLSGQISFYAPNLFLSLPYIEAGKLRALGVTSPQRSSIAPQLPTIAEAGLPGYDVTTWFGIFVPGATPRETVAKLQQELAQAVDHPELRKRLAADGLTPVASTPEQFADFVARETAKYSRLIQSIGIKAAD